MIASVTSNKEKVMSSIRTKLATAAAVAAAAVGGATIANAATSSTASTSSTAATSAANARPPMQRDHSKAGHQANGKTEVLLTGDTAAKVKAAALKKVAGTVERVETNVDGSAPYEAHIRKSDGTEVEVQVGSDFNVTAVNAMGHP